MATILFAAAGAAIGAGFGGTVLGLSSAVIGRAVGATVGRVIDQAILGGGSSSVETGRIERFRLTGASEGAPLGVVWGRMRVGGQVIWASPFVETKEKEEVGGKGAPTSTITRYSYSVSVAVAVGEGEITCIGRIWADGAEIAPDDVQMRVYTGSEDQLPDPKIEAVEGAGRAPAYRGTAYVVFENLDLAAYGNRVPQFSFEVIRPAQGEAIGPVEDLTRGVRAVAMIPGSGEYALATRPVHYGKGPGVGQSANVNTASGRTDFLTSLEALKNELPNCGSVSLVVSWFGDDLRCGQCSLRPKVEQGEFDGANYPWRVSDQTRRSAQVVAQMGGRPIYGGTPADASVIEAIRALKAAGKKVVFYPFILMEQLAGNGRADPWTGAEDQPALPWRGRITLSSAPGRQGSPDRTDLAAAEVAAFFGGAAREDFTPSGELGPLGTEGGKPPTIAYHGPDEWSYRRFILHYAWLCRAAGGVDGFCIGSEMRALTQIRGAGDSFPAVQQLRQLAAGVRLILGQQTNIGYAADWSEYAGYDAGEGNRYFHLDPLWADPAINFIGIDNYMPVSDWRDGTDHADAGWDAIYNLDYLKSNIAGGEGYDWYYAHDAHRDAQIRTPITDGDHGEPWIWRVKDIRNWWENAHHDRIGGVRADLPTGWVPRSKPVWFTEMGCAAIDKGGNEPNKFLDPRSSESDLPHYSNGRRDDLMQMQYLRAMRDFWVDPANNPASDLYDGPMVDMERAHVWAWDARPFPQFPNDVDLWTDGDNWARGHWISGRTAAQPLDNVVAEICARSGQRMIDVSGLYSVVRGYAASGGGNGRSALQPLMLAYGFDAIERDGVLRFRMRRGVADGAVRPETLALGADAAGALEATRASQADIASRIRLTFVEAQGDFETRAVEAVLPDAETRAVAETEFPLSLTRAEGQGIAERWLAEVRVARDGLRLSLPPSQGALGAGDVFALEGEDGEAQGLYRIDRVEVAGAAGTEAVRVEPGVYLASDEAEERVVPRPFSAPVPVFAQFLDLPLLTGEEVPHAPHLAVTATPWPGSVAVYSSASDAGYELNVLMSRRAVIGVTETALARAAPDNWDLGAPLRVRIYGGTLSSADEEAVLNGANSFAIGSGASSGWEVLQCQRAVLVAEGVYDLDLRLRGQLGTDADMPDEWPVGSYLVRIDGALQQIALSASARGLARHYRIGSASRGYDDPSYVHLLEAFRGIGLRPYAPCQLGWTADGAGGGTLRWIRRTRIDGDSWESVEVPLGETREAYEVRVVVSGVIRREETVSTPAWTYSAAQRAADAATAGFEIQVAQLSDAFGPGPFERIEIND
ncbi:MAG: glycoside hydrolase/phage tail family protein [Defluviimonas sp.]|nr:glycoside hydrolase/phage tail family protein [Defluviimonas sp.]